MTFSGANRWMSAAVTLEAYTCYTDCHCQWMSTLTVLTADESSLRVLADVAGQTWHPIRPQKTHHGTISPWYWLAMSLLSFWSTPAVGLGTTVCELWGRCSCSHTRCCPCSEPSFQVEWQHRNDLRSARHSLIIIHLLLVTFGSVRK